MPLGVNAALLGQADTPSGGSFANACAGVDGQMGGAGNPGQAFVTTATFQCNTFVTPAGSPFTHPVASSASGTINGKNYSNSAHAASLPGNMRFDASNDGNSAIPFPGAGVDVGYNDTVTVNSGNGNSGSVLWVLPFHLKGTMNSTVGGDGHLEIAAYLNHNLIHGASFTTFNALNVATLGDVLSGTDVEIYRAQVDGVVTSLTIDDTVQFVIPITLGTAFDYGIWAKLAAGEQSSGPAGPQNQTVLDFSDFAYLGGSYVILPNGNTDNNLNFTSAAGLDYTKAAVPLPASVGLFSFGLLALIRRRTSNGPS
jgi:hypothetical protein